MEKDLHFNKKAWAKERSLELAKSYIIENPDVKWSEQFLQQRFYEIIINALEKVK